MTNNVKSKHSLYVSLNTTKAETCSNAAPISDKSVKQYIKKSGIMKVSSNTQSDKAPAVIKEYHFHPCLTNEEIADHMLEAIIGTVRATRHHLRRALAPGRYSPSVSKVSFCLRKYQSDVTQRLLDTSEVVSTTTASVHGRLGPTQISSCLRP